VRYVLIVVWLACVLGCAGCAALKVTRLDPINSRTDPIDGIPFYALTAGCKHETIWVQPVYSVLVRIAADPEAAAGDRSRQHVLFEDFRVLSLSQYSRINKALRSRATSEAREDLLAFWQSTMQPLDYDPLSEDFADAVHNQNVKLQSNTSMLSTFVDYSRPFYLNSSRSTPASGLSSAIGPDGTLAGQTSPALSGDPPRLQASATELLVFRFNSGTDQPKVLADRGAKTTDGIEIRVKIDEALYSYAFYDLTAAPHRTCVPPTATLTSGHYVHSAAPLPAANGVDANR
jgi:hypothetical protein